MEPKDSRSVAFWLLSLPPDGGTSHTERLSSSAAGEAARGWARCWEDVAGAQGQDGREEPALESGERLAPALSFPGQGREGPVAA